MEVFKSSCSDVLQGFFALPEQKLSEQSGL